MPLLREKKPIFNMRFDSPLPTLSNSTHALSKTSYYVFFLPFSQFGILFFNFRLFIKQIKCQKRKLFEWPVATACVSLTLTRCM